ncbi:MAG: TraM recognition domain-containing protein, partial [Verrucomicrobiota bacterium]
GIVWNGRTRNNVERGQDAFGTSGDRLASRLLPLVRKNAEVRFIFGGGAAANFSWSIQGIVHEAASKEIAIAEANSLRQGLQMVLASEPSFKFVLKVLRAHERSEPPVPSWKTNIVPRRISLKIPEQSTFGFGSGHQEKQAIGTTVGMGLPRYGATSFRSFAEAVLLNASPILLVVSFTRFDLDEECRAVASKALRWMQRNPLQFQNQLTTAGNEPALADNLREQLQEWLQNPTGGKVRCSILSRERPVESFVEMVGEDVFGTRVEVLSEPVESCDAETCDGGITLESKDLDLSCCLRLGAVWPSLFPSLDSISIARVQRLFNHETPDFSVDGMLLGFVAEDQRLAVRLAEPDRSQHLYVLGATGTGKSTLLFNMLLQDIRAGRGVGLIDPHGDLYDQLLEAMPLSRAKDVVLFNPGSLESAPGINVLECDGPNRSMQVNFAINELLKTIDRLYDMRICGGPMFETYFRNAMLLLMESGLKEVALTELPLVFEDSDYRKFLKSRCKNPLVVGFWTNQAEKVRGDAALENMGPYIASKINAFTCNALIRPIVGQAKSTIDLLRVLDNRGILLVKLPKGILGQLDTQLLGSLLLSKIFATAMGRARVKSTKRTTFHLYVDEFQNFTNDTVAHILSEARKYGLHLTLANQNLSQLQANPGSQNILDALLGNVGNLIAFRIGPRDAEKLWPYTEPEFGSLDLQGLPNYHAVGRLLNAQGPTRPFVFQTLPPTRPRGYRRGGAEAWATKEESFTRPIAE